MAEQENTFTLDGITHSLDTLDDQGKFLIGQLNTLNQDKTNILAKLDIINTAEMGYIDKLRDNLQESEEEEKPLVGEILTDP